MFVGSEGQAWRSFYESPQNNIGLFLRNAVIYNYPGGMVQFYKDKGVIPQTAIATSTTFATNYTLRLAPQELAATAFGSSSNLSGSVQIYGWLDAGGILSDGISTYWLLIADGSNRLLWVAAAGITHTPSQVTGNPQVTSQALTQLSPGRSYDNTDLLAIIGG